MQWTVPRASNLPLMQPDAVTRWSLSICTLHCPMLSANQTQLFLMQWDIKVQVATMYKKEGFVHNSKQG